MLTLLSHHSFLESYGKLPLTMFLIMFEWLVAIYAFRLFLPEACTLFLLAYEAGDDVYCMCLSLLFEKQFHCN